MRARWLKIRMIEEEWCIEGLQEKWHRTIASQEEDLCKQRREE